MAKTLRGSQHTNGVNLTPKMSSCPQEGHYSEIPKAIKNPSQPLVRRDSLHAYKNQILSGEQYRTTETIDSLHQEKANLDIEPPSRDPNRFCCHIGSYQVTNEGHLNCELGQPPESSQQISEHAAMEASTTVVGISKVCDKTSSLDSSPVNGASDELTKSSFGSLTHITGATVYHHSVPEQLLVSQLHHMHLDSQGSKGMELPTATNAHEYTLSPLQSSHTQQKSLYTPEEQPNIEQNTTSVDERLLDSEHHNPHNSPQGESYGKTLEKGFLESNKTNGRRSGLASQQPSACSSFGQKAQYSSTTNVAGSTEVIKKEDYEPKGCGLTGGKRGRSIQNRRKNERFATSLRNEIQKRKAQLQKSKIPLHSDNKEPVEETEDPPECPPVLPSNSFLHSSYENTASPRNKPLYKNTILMTKNSDDLSQVSESHESRTDLDEQISPSPRPDQNSLSLNNGWIASELPVSDSKKVNVHNRVREGHWRWSPEHNLQNQVTLAIEDATSSGYKELKASVQAVEEAILSPFAVRRKFF